MTGFEAYLLARAYTNKAIEGGGSLKGAACQIKSIEPITGGNRVTFEWEDNQGVVSTDTMDVMNGQDGSDGADGVGIVSITYKSEDAQGNYIYTVALSDSTSYDITCPKGATGDTGATGATGNGIASITKTGTSGLVDTYTITYTNGTTSTFTVTNGADANLTAGQYIDIDNDEISVKRDIARDVDAIITTRFDYPNCTVTKTIDEEVVDTVTFSIFGDVPSSVMDVYSVSYNPQAMVLTFTNTVASKEHAVGYTFQVASYSSGVIDTQTFVETVDADKKLIIKSELDTALAGKVNTSAVGVAGGVAGLGNDGKVPASQLPAQQELTAGLYIEIDGDEISVKRDITQTAQEIAYNFTIPGDYTLRVKKYMNGDLVDTTDYQFNSVTDPINLDSIMEVSKKPGGGFYWVVKNLIASTTQAADYSVELYALQTTTNYTQNFVATIDADKKLIIQSELDAALADKVDKVAGKGLSKNDYTDADKAKVDASLNVFTGTQAEWAALSTAEKKTYQRADFTDDYDNTAIGDLTALHTSAKSSIVNAINEVADGKQNSTDNNLQTTSKTIVGGINEVKSGLIKKTHYTETTDTDGDVAINVIVGDIVAIIPDRSKGEDGCYTSWFTGFISTNTQGTFYSIKFVDATLSKIASTKMAFDVLYI